MIAFRLPPPPARIVQQERTTRCYTALAARERVPSAVVRALSLARFFRSSDARTSLKASYRGAEM